MPESGPHPTNEATPTGSRHLAPSDLQWCNSTDATIGARRAWRGELAVRKGADDEREATWQDSANCLGVDPDLFFPERGASTKEAKEVCRGCVVREECLEYALANGEKFGIWGGLSERERRRVRRARALARRAASGGDGPATA
jgi:WhiB family transcriptional regulator, redox-sensing transcriptional regulator